MEMKDFTPYIRYACDQTLDKSFHLERTIWDYELIYVKEGQMRYRENGEEYVCSAGDILFLRPGIEHTLSLVDGKMVRQPHVHFDFYTLPDSAETMISFKKLQEMTLEERKHFRRDVAGRFPVTLPSVMHLRNADKVEAVLMELIEEYDKSEPCRELMLQALFMKLWAILVREYIRSTRANDYEHQEELEWVRNYMDTHPSESICLDELALKVNLSKFHLIRIFKKVYHITPIKCHTEARLRRAREMLVYTSIPITELSEKLGFQSIHGFSRWFKNLEGMSPQNYRDRARETGEQ